MRVFVSVDMEGIAGVATLDQTVRTGTGYPRAQRLMTREANAAIRGAFTGGATHVVINDSHGTMDNLLHDELDPRARLIFGRPRPACMVQGVQRDDRLAIFIGYHAAAGADGVLAHTFSPSFTQVRLNDHEMTEAEVNALYAAELGVPVGVLTGDNEICNVAEKAFPGIRTVAVKDAHGYSATSSLSPTEACAQIEATVSAAVEDHDTFAPTTLPDSWELSVDLTSPLAADLAATVPGSRRPSARTVEFTAVAGAAELIQVLTAWYYLASIAAAETSALASRR